MIHQRSDVAERDVLRMYALNVGVIHLANGASVTDIINTPGTLILLVRAGHGQAIVASISHIVEIAVHPDAPLLAYSCVLLGSVP